MKTKMTEEKLKKSVANSISIAESLKRLEMSITTGNYKTFHKFIKIYKIDITHFLGQAHLTGKSNLNKKTFSLDQILIENSTYSAISSLKTRLLRVGLFRYECYECGISTWKNKKITLQLDHINGISNDHRLENLRLLCPNCHSQTETYGGKNKKEINKQYFCECGMQKLKNSKTCIKCAAKKREKINWPSQNILQQMVQETNYSITARKLGVSPTSVRDRLVRSSDPATE